MVVQDIKSILKTILPRSFICGLRSIVARLRIIRAQKVFRDAPRYPVWLDRHDLDILQQQYSPPPSVSYDSHSLEKKGEERAEEILKLIRTETERFNTFLELGCWDGMVCYELQKSGKQATGIDMRSAGFEEKALSDGVKLYQMDAANLEFESESFDFVFSYEAFEHFGDPRRVFEEAIRVVKPGGYIYLVVGHLYMSPLGLHAYRSVTVPYSQFLFPKDVLEEFVNMNRLSPIDFDQVNGWPLEGYRKLWNDYSHKLQRIKYYEIPNVSYLDLIVKYPSCFKSKCDSFDNLIVSSIEVLFKKN